MAHDGSLASLIEEWICTQIKALAPFTNSVVEPYPGSTIEDGNQFLNETLANRPLYAAVLFEGDRVVPAEEGEHLYDGQYVILIAVQNSREGAARKGDGTTPGTNLIRDLMRSALHNQRPNLSANGWYADITRFEGVQMAFQRRDAFIMRATVVVREVPAAV